MANKVYPKYKEALIQGSPNTSLTGTVKAALVDLSAYTYDDTHTFLTSLSGVVGTAQEITGKTYTNGYFDGADVTYTTITGNSAEAIVIYIDTGVAGTSRLVAYIDSGVTGLPVQPNGGDIDITWDALGILRI